MWGILDIGWMWAKKGPSAPHILCAWKRDGRVAETVYLEGLGGKCDRKHTQENRLQT